MERTIKGKQEKRPMIFPLMGLALFLSFAALAQEDLDSFPPVVVKTIPTAGDASVDPGLKEIQVTFSRKMMDKSWSLVHANPDQMPKSVGVPEYSPDGLTFKMKVKLEAGKTYALWLNQGRFGNFKDANGKSAVPYLLSFQTKK